MRLTQKRASQSNYYVVYEHLNSYGANVASVLLSSRCTIFLMPLGEEFVWVLSINTKTAQHIKT